MARTEQAFVIPCHYYSWSIIMKIDCGDEGKV